jgi:hypothetical protein
MLDRYIPSRCYAVDDDDDDDDDDLPAQSPESSLLTALYQSVL